MSRALYIGGLLLLVAASGLCDQKKAGKEPPMRKVVPVHGPRNGGVPKAPPPRLANPANPVAHLYTATPDQRERILEKLPPKLQDAMRKNLADFDSLPKDQQQIRLRQADRFEALTPEKQRAFRQQIMALNNLDKERQQAVRQVLRRLQVVPDSQRNQIFNSPAFKNRFSPEEQKLILDLSEVW